MTRDTASIVSCITAGTGIWLSQVVIRKYLLKMLFSYHGWMYQVHSKQSLKSKIWAVSEEFDLNISEFDGLC
jgi:hypothetical protein